MESDESLNYDFLIQGTAEKFFTDREFALIEKNFQNTQLQHNPSEVQQYGPILV